MSLRKLDQLDEAMDEAVAAFRVDKSFLASKAESLRQRGYLIAAPSPAHYVQAVEDAARACVLDERCW
jgi:hypothetical protein